MEMEAQPGGLTGCPEVQQKIPSVSGCGWDKERARWRTSRPGIPRKRKADEAHASGTARPRGRQRAAVGLRSLAGASAATAVPEGSPWECGEHLSPHTAARRPSRHVEGWAKALSGCPRPQGRRARGRARGTAWAGARVPLPRAGRR